MDDRKQRVLRAIVTLYGTDGEPVGSVSLARAFGGVVSSATLRSEMAALTKLGLLEQPHTSAGRVPSTKGYRYYLDNLLDMGASLSGREKQHIDALFAAMDRDPERLAQSAARALAELTGCGVIATTPRSEDVCIAHFEVVQVGRFSVAVLAVTSAGGVRTRTVKLDVPLRAGDAAWLAESLNASLTFRRAADIGASEARAAAERLGAGQSVYHPVAEAAVTLLREAGRASVFLEGQENLPDCTGDVHTLRTMMAFFADTDALRRCLGAKTDRTAVVLGEELAEYPMPGVCFMTRRYVAGGGLTGLIGLVGSTRMPYREMVPRLEYFALLLGETMSGQGV